MICFAIAFAGSFATNSSVSSWYQTLEKPFFTPPAWLFPPVWTILYIMIAVSGWMLYNCKQKTRAFTFYCLQLFFNGIWSFLFFYFRQPVWAFIDILALDVAILATIYFSWSISRTASILLFPYLLWVLFATILNGSIAF
ncbi:MAG: tryptophan-rich sensory protein [Parachlamydiales bacterium]|nr:tryptophan-rich sensory protein [Parachlamydiales bacterium]